MRAKVFTVWDVSSYEMWVYSNELVCCFSQVFILTVPAKFLQQSFIYYMEYVCIYELRIHMHVQQHRQMVTSKTEFSLTKNIAH